jgi:anti-sigma regulatory factor (Ser/Thr protein kinase)
VVPVRLTVPSVETFLEPVQVIVERIGAIAGVEEDELTSLSIAVLELVKNGMEHGNRMDPDTLLSIQFDILPGRLQIQVDDQGNWTPCEEIGFKPGEGEQLQSCRGRGILIARNLARWIEFGRTPEGKTRATLVWPLT